MTKTPKLYFCDTGLLCFLLNVRSADELERSPLRGAIFETAVYGELRRQLALGQELESLYFFRDRSREVDFLIHRGGRFHLLECKWTELPSAADVAPMADVAAQLGPDRIAGKTLVCRTGRPFPIGREARATNLEHLDG